MMIYRFLLTCLYILYIKTMINTNKAVMDMFHINKSQSNVYKSIDSVLMVCCKCKLFWAIVCRNPLCPVDISPLEGENRLGR